MILDEIKKEIKDIQKDVDKKLDSLFPLYTMTDVRDRLKKEDKMSKQVEALTTRVESIEGTLGKILENQAAQTALLQQFIQASTHNQTLDADKKGEKTVVATSQTVESSKGTKATTEGEHLEPIPTTEGELHVDSIASRLANSTGVSTQIIPVHTTTLKVLTPPIVLPVKKKLGEPSSKNEFRSMVKKIQSPIKTKGKNSERIAFPLPYPDEGKFLGQQIANYKNTTDVVLKRMMAIINRDGKQIHVFGSHPNFVEAKKEEAANAKIQDEDEEKQQRLAQELLKELDDEMNAEAEVDNQPMKQKKNRGKSAAKRQPRTKARAKRVKSPEEQVETTEPQPTVPLPTTQTQTSIPYAFNFEEIKPEPMEFDFDINSLVFPKYRLSPDRPKTRRSRKQPTTQIQIAEVPQIAKEPSRKDTELYIADIEEQSNINLYLDDIIEMKGFGATTRMPERLTFLYKGGNEITWPLHHILKESYSKLTRIWSSMKREGGYTPTAKAAIFNKIKEIRSSWNSKEGLPRKLNIPYSPERKVHLYPFWILEFHDQSGCRRFFRIEDQLKKASNEYLQYLMSMLDPDDHEEGMFYRTLEKQIEANKIKIHGLRKARKTKD